MKETNNTLVNDILLQREKALDCLLMLGYYKDDLPEIGRYLQEFKEGVFAGKIRGLPDGNVIAFMASLTGIINQLQGFYLQNPTISPISASLLQ